MAIGLSNFSAKPQIFCSLAAGFKTLCYAVWMPFIVSQCWIPLTERLCQIHCRIYDARMTFRDRHARIFHNSAPVASIARKACVYGGKDLGLEEVPCVQLSHMNPEQKRAYVLADNKLALNAGWDEDMLAGELEALLEMDLNFDIGVIGFTISEIDSLIEDKANDDKANEGACDPVDDVLQARVNKNMKT